MSLNSQREKEETLYEKDHQRKKESAALESPLNSINSRTVKSMKTINASVNKIKII